MNTNEKLLKIFDKKDFRQNDRAEIIKSKTEIKIHEILNGKIYWGYCGSWVDIKKVTLIQPAVGFSDVLVELMEKDVLFFIGYGYTEGKEIMLTVEASSEVWQLGKDLWHQSDETKKFIAKILTKE